jgi:hypothetical protein
MPSALGLDVGARRLQWQRLKLIHYPTRIFRSLG